MSELFAFSETKGLHLYSRDSYWKSGEEFRFILTEMCLRVAVRRQQKQLLEVFSIFPWKWMTKLKTDVVYTTMPGHLLDWNILKIIVGWSQKTCSTTRQLKIWALILVDGIALKYSKYPKSCHDVLPILYEPKHSLLKTLFTGYKDSRTKHLLKFNESTNTVHNQELR